MRKIEAQLGRSNERTLLIDMVSEYLAEGIIKDMCSGVVVPQRPTPQLGRAKVFAHVRHKAGPSLESTHLVV